MKTLLLFLLAGFSLPIHADVLLGNSVDVKWQDTFFGPAECGSNISCGFANDPGPAIVPTTFFGLQNGVNVAVNDADIVVNGFQSGTWGGPGATFIGWVLTDETAAPITSVSIDPSTNMVGFNNSDITFTANAITVDFNNLPFDPATVVALDLNTVPTPEPTTVILLPGALGILCWIRAAQRSRRPPSKPDKARVYAEADQLSVRFSESYTICGRARASFEQFSHSLLRTVGVGFGGPNSGPRGHIL